MSAQHDFINAIIASVLCYVRTVTESIRPTSITVEISRNLSAIRLRRLARSPANGGHPLSRHAV
ncbi:MAG TPA: hypothetical protein VLM79_16145 [Kofleriaceae bacterium]|nr:hypothetical protein [Kofleriaceae bacterium]